MKPFAPYFFLTFCLLALTSCGNDDSSGTASGASGTASSGVVFTGIDANAEYDRLAAELPGASRLPAEGASKTTVSRGYSAMVGGFRCHYIETSNFQISHVSADSFDESYDRSYAKVTADPSGCPDVPPDAILHHVRTWKNTDYTAAKLQWLKLLLDLRARAQRETWIARIGIKSSDAAVATLPDGQAQRVQRITFEIVATNGGKRSESYDVSTDAWFLGEVSASDANNLAPLMPFYQVTAYKP